MQTWTTATAHLDMCICTPLPTHIWKPAVLYTSICSFTPIPVQMEACTTAHQNLQANITTFLPEHVYNWTLRSAHLYWNTCTTVHMHYCTHALLHTCMCILKLNLNTSMCITHCPPRRRVLMKKCPASRTPCVRSVWLGNFSVLTAFVTNCGLRR